MPKVVTHINSSLLAKTNGSCVERSVNTYTVILFYPETLPKDMSSAMLAPDIWSTNIAQALANGGQLKTFWITCHRRLGISKCLQSIGSPFLQWCS